MSDNRRGANTLIGLAAVGPAIVGIASFVAALVALLGADFVGAGLLLIASGLSLSLLSIAVLGG